MLMISTSAKAFSKLSLCKIHTPVSSKQTLELGAADRQAENKGWQIVLILFLEEGGSQ